MLVSAKYIIRVNSKSHGQFERFESVSSYILTKSNQTKPGLSSKSSKETCKSCSIYYIYRTLENRSVTGGQFSFLIE